MPSSTDTSREHLLARLEAREAELGAAVRALQQEREDTPSEADPQRDVEDFGERGEHLLRTELSHAERERYLAELRAIAAAKERLADGSYGACVDCGTDIPQARLESQPSCERCLACQEAYERTHAVGPRILQTP